MSDNLNRRQFVGSAAAAVYLPAWLRADEPKTTDEPVVFFLVGDTHFLANKDQPAKLDVRSAAVTGRLVDRLNTLPGTDIPPGAGGGKVLAPRGVIHAGDCIDTGDKANEKMQESEWAAFADAYGLTGKDGKLRVPVYEVHGNHDSPRGDGLAVRKITERNKTRPGVTNTSKNGVHYSWDWGGVHFVCLGIVVGQVGDVPRRRRYAPLGSLEFLVSDLREKVGASGRPVVVTQHVDMLRYAQPLPVEDKKAEAMEWDPADVKGFHDALKGYNVAAILYGHTHARNVYRWDGSNKAARIGIPTFNVDNSSHFAGKQQAFFYFEIHADRVVVREYQTTDAWETGNWTPQTWTAPVARAGK
ncbi:MAG: metallophosphoesterase [Gemmataceae bacterium]|nr:metallophosphoesterase [Gemmataceae bacterium]